MLNVTWRRGKRVLKELRPKQEGLESIHESENSKAEINVLLDREIRMWSQRSRVLWLSKGDSNSKNFHSKATHKHRKNTILGIRDKWGRWQDQPNGIGQTLIDFYGELFTTSSGKFVRLLNKWLCLKHQGRTECYHCFFSISREL